MFLNIDAAVDERSDILIAAHGAAKLRIDAGASQLLDIEPREFFNSSSNWKIFTIFRHSTHSRIIGGLQGRVGPQDERQSFGQ